MQDAYGSTALMIRRLRTAQAIIGFLKRQYVEASTDEFKDYGHLHRGGYHKNE